MTDSQRNNNGAQTQKRERQSTDNDQQMASNQKKKRNKHSSFSSPSSKFKQMNRLNEQSQQLWEPFKSRNLDKTKIYISAEAMNHGSLVLQQVQSDQAQDKSEQLRSGQSKQRFKFRSSRMASSLNSRIGSRDSPTIDNRGVTLMYPESTTSKQLRSTQRSKVRLTTQDENQELINRNYSRERFLSTEGANEEDFYSSIQSPSPRLDDKKLVHTGIERSPRIKSKQPAPKKSYKERENRKVYYQWMKDQINEAEKRVGLLQPTTVGI